MDASATTQKFGPDARAEALVASYERAGYTRVAPAMLQPAEPFLDLSGEDIRRRMFLTTAPDGDEFCLRPDLTIPVSRDYLALAVAGKPAGYCYLGPVFRHRRDAPPEFLQAGIESFGRADKAAADAEMLALGLEATAHYGLASPHIVIGDVALFASLIAGLDLAALPKRREVPSRNEACEKCDVADFNVRRGKPVMRRCFEAKRQHLGIGRCFVGAPEGFDTGLQKFRRRVSTVTKYRTEITVACRLSGNSRREIVARYRNGKIGPQAKFIAVGCGGQKHAASDVLAGQIEERFGRLQHCGRNTGVTGSLI